jgi:hypothetical protein
LSFANPKDLDTLPFDAFHTTGCSLNVHSVTAKSSKLAMQIVESCNIGRSCMSIMTSSRQACIHTRILLFVAPCKLKVEVSNCAVAPQDKDSEGVESLSEFFGNPFTQVPMHDRPC